jgi:hypothetical protein
MFSWFLRLDFREQSCIIAKKFTAITIQIQLFSKKITITIKIGRIHPF